MLDLRPDFAEGEPFVVVARAAGEIVGNEKGARWDE